MPISSVGLFEPDKCTGAAHWQLRPLRLASRQLPACPCFALGELTLLGDFGDLSLAAHVELKARHHEIEKTGVSAGACAAHREKSMKLD